ncbi:DMT family transporter [Aminobacter sp. HY435]|uniref:DMT family transporter n=1 Tax=Aminobacter sp. HY435 TaxID=2970917 RepID=UPI0022B9BFBB|nr:DMT family transporter [Aminobacter sp. HY435]
MMIGRLTDGLVAFGAGAFLAGMIASNSLLAERSSPVTSSLFAHGIGAVVALLLLAGWRVAVKPDVPRVTAPGWAYLGGIPGAFTVVLAAITANGPLALSGTIAFMLVGQVMFGMAADRCGFLGITQRRLEARDLVVATLVLGGSVLLVVGRQ